MWPLFPVIIVLSGLVHLISAQGHPLLPLPINEIIEKVQESSAKADPEPELTPRDLRSKYDFIIVGSGPAGCVLANRLSENPRINVLLLEAGPRPTILNEIPFLAPMTIIPPETRWDFVTSPTPGACLGFKGQVCNYYLGKILGGSSSLNAMIYVRGNRYDFDKWQEMGNYGWGYDDVLPLFLKLENTTMWRHDDAVDDALRGREGELVIKNANFHSKGSDQFVMAAKERGLDLVDINGNDAIGVDYVQGTIKNGRRFNAVKAYLDPVKRRNNLHVMVNCLVTKVIIDPATKITEGVEFVHLGDVHLVKAKKEVILSAGPINSPHLLMLSGIGPKSDLDRFNIPVLSDLPVGMKYLDHVGVNKISAYTNLFNETLDFLRITPDDIEEYVEKGSGKLTVPAANEVIAMMHNGFNDMPKDKPNTEIVFTTGRFSEGIEGFTPLRDEIYRAVYKTDEDSTKGRAGLQVIDLYPKAQGRLRLRGNSINDVPIIEIPLFEDPRDMETLVWAAKEAMALLKTKAMKSIGTRLITRPLPYCVAFAFGSDDYWRCYIRHMGSNILHAAATNKMGPPDDVEAVVDPQLRVYGVGRLRVADSSIAPTTAACHTQAISYVVGEKLAELLKKNWEL